MSCLCEKLRKTDAQEPISYLQAAGGWEMTHSPILFPVLLNDLSFDREHVTFYDKENMFLLYHMKMLVKCETQERLSLTFQ